MAAGAENLKHVVVVMMSGRSFDHMLGGLHRDNPAIDGLTGSEFNLDTTGEPIKATPDAEFQGQLDPAPDHHFAAVDLQIFGGITMAQNPNRQPNMEGFVQSYYNQQHNIVNSRKIMCYFTPDKLPVLTSLATNFAVFNRWFSSVPGDSPCNRAPFERFHIRATPGGGLWSISSVTPNAERCAANAENLRSR